MTPTPTRRPRGVEYPDQDGNPMSDSTLQFRWIVTLQGNLDLLFRDDPDVFVAGDHLIYPVEGNTTVRQAPDVYVAFGRPKGDRGSYRVWEEGGVFPQVVFEVVSPGARVGEMARKLDFFERSGTEEYYILDPDRIRMEGYVRRGAELIDVEDMNGYVSPRLGIRFGIGEDLEVYYPDGRPFLTFVELGTHHQEAVRRAEAEHQRAEAERRRAEAERQRADEAEKRADALAARLRELGLNGE